MKYSLAIDIDDTLAETAKTIMELSHQKFSSEDPELIEDLLATHAQPGNVSKWQTPEAQSFIESLLDSEEFLASLEAVPGSQEALTSLAETQTVACYISSRLDTFQTVSEVWLKRNNFPEAPIITRPDSERRQNWKMHYLAENYDTHHFVLIDDTNDAFEDIPPEFKGNCIYFDRWHREHNQQKALACHSWAEICKVLTNNAL